MKIATSMLDPGLYADVYGDEPYLYGPALSGLFSLHIGELEEEQSAEEQLSALEEVNDGVVEEGATGSGQTVREESNVPVKWKKRRKHFLDPQHLADFTFEKGRMYHADFFNAHLDFANFALRLPGFSMSVVKYVDEKTHHLRYVLRNRRSGKVLFVVMFKLLFREESDKMEGEKRSESEMDLNLDAGGDGSKGGEEQGLDRVKSAPVTECGEATLAGAEKLRQTKTVEVEKPSAQVATSATKNDGDDEESGYSGTGAVSTLSNSIYAAFVAMGLWGDTSSSSDVEETHQIARGPLGQHLNTKVDDLDDATVESFLQSRQGNAG